MSPSKYEYSKAYKRDFDPRQYLTDFYSTLEGDFEEGESLNFRLKTIIEFSGKLPNKIERALDFGCGPLVEGLMSVAEKIQSAVLSDYVSENLKEIEKWMANTDDCFSVRPFSGVHAEATGSTPEKIEAALRSSFKGTMSCDILAEEILPLNKGNLFDYIFTALCIESCCTTKADYDNGIKKLSKLLTPGGFAIQYCVLHQTEYELRNVKRSVLPITFEDAKDAWVKAGCVIVESRYFPNIVPEDERGVCTLLVRK